MRFIKHIGWLVLVGGLVLAGCLPRPSTPTPTPDRATRQQMPTPTPPAWQEPFTPVTLDNVETVQQVGRLDPPTTDSGSAFAHTFSVDGTLLAALNRNELNVWDIISGGRLFTLPRRDALDVFFAPDKSTLFTVDADGRVIVIDGSSGATLTTFGIHPDFINGAFAYDPAAGVLAGVSIQGNIAVWDVLAGETLTTVITENPEINSLIFSPDGTRLAVSDEAGAVEVWDWREGTRSARLSTEQALVVVRVAMSADNAQLAAATDEDIRLWDVAAQTIDAVLLTGQGGSTDVLTYTPGGAYLVNSGLADALNIWDPATGDLVGALPELGGEPTSVAFSPGGDLMLTSVFQGGVYVWDVTTFGRGEGVGRAPLGTAANVIDVAWSPDGRALALFTAAGGVEVWGIPADPTPTPDPTADAGA